MSKFKNILNAARDRQPESENNPVEQVIDKQEIVEQVITAKSETEIGQRKGRPKGKRSDPNYEQVTAYIRKDTYLKVKIALLEKGERIEFSELVQELLEEWVNSRT